MSIQDRGVPTTRIGATLQRVERRYDAQVASLARFVLGLFVLALVLAPASAQSVQEKYAVPSAEELEEARGKLREFYAEELKQKEPEAALELARTLRAQADLAVVGEAAHFVLLEESVRAAGRSPDARFFLELLDQLLAAYSVDELQVSLWAFELYDPQRDGAVTGVRIAERCLVLAENGARAGDFDAAKTLLAKAEEIAKANGLGVVRERVRILTGETTAWQKLAKNAQRAESKLETDPESIRAHLDVARFLLAVREDWDGALPHLAHGVDSKLGEALEREERFEQASEDAAQAAQLDLARRWREIAKKERKGPLREAFFRRADHWYAAAVAGTADLLDRGKIEEERDEIRTDFGPDQIFLADLTEIFLHAPLGELGKDGWMGLGDDVVQIGGVLKLHSLALHAGALGNDAVVRYDLGRAWETLVGQVAINDTSHATFTAPLDFRIFGDGRLIWSSETLTTVRDVQRFKVSVKRVKTLELRIVCSDVNRSAHTIWVDPILER